MKNNKIYLDSNNKEKGEYIMEKKYASVKTVSDVWVDNVKKGFFKYSGEIDIDYWTNGWTPKENIDILSVYYQKELLFIGDVQSCYKEDYNNVYKDFSSNLFSIGLVPGDKLIDFEDILKNAFSGSWNPEDQIGNILFRITAITPKFKRLLEELQKNDSTFVTPKNIKELERDYSMPKELEGRITFIYDENIK